MVSQKYLVVSPNRKQKEYKVPELYDSRNHLLGLHMTSILTDDYKWDVIKSRVEQWSSPAMLWIKCLLKTYSLEGRLGGSVC